MTHVNLCRTISMGCLLLLLTGCGLLGYDYVYNRIDKLLADRIEHTLDLNRMQSKRLADSLKALHQQHRLTELPYYVAYLEYVNTVTADGLTGDEAKAIMNNLDILYTRLMAQFIPVLAVTLNELNDDQLIHLEKQFVVYNEEKHREFGLASHEERLRSRIDRHREAYVFWLGSLTKTQEILIENNANNFPDIEPLWQNRRTSMQRALLNLLWQHADSATLGKLLYRWSVEDNDKPPDLSKAEKQAAKQVIALTIRLFDALEPRQKAHLRNKLEKLAETLEALTPTESRIKIAGYRRAFLQNAVQLSASANCFNVASDKAASSC
ncbi:MAG TPA: DUF6279 family lipoprotein [Gammaproteobacteria bacterium]|jgi:hypothetical protein